MRALITFEASRQTEVRRGVRHQAPTLIGCLVVKELQRPALPSLRCVADVSSFAAAEKRDYAEHSSFRQQFAEDFFLCRSALQTFAPLTTVAPQPLSPLRLQCVSCCEGANIRPVRRPLQYKCHASMLQILADCSQLFDHKGKSGRKYFPTRSITLRKLGVFPNQDFSDCGNQVHVSPQTQPYLPSDPPLRRSSGTNGARSAPLHSESSHRQRSPIP